MTFFDEWERLKPTKDTECPAKAVRTHFSHCRIGLRDRISLRISLLSHCGNSSHK
jgi:hypothetical protein